VVLTRLWLAWLRHRQILDLPNGRSSHDRPTPRGGGVAPVAVVLALWGWTAVSGAGPDPFGDPLLTAVVIGAALGLATVSWLDDVFTLPALPRFVVQCLGVAAGLILLPAEALVFQGALPQAADRFVTALGWLWFVNLFNFMDGIDGISGTETTALGGGLAVLAALGFAPAAVGLPGLALAGAALGFLVWNWHPAKVFLGDVGSVPLGYLLGFLLIVLAGSGQLAAALILPLYYLADATLTLLRRLSRGAKPWQPHREHFYQVAVRGGWSHARVSGLIAAANGLLVACAVVAAAGQPAAGLAVAGAGVAGVLGLLAWRGRTIAA